MDEKLSVAPMMECTDRHYRYMMRGITKCTTLYTEMVVDSTVMHQIPHLDFFVGKDICEDPSVIQIGGHDPDSVAAAAAVCTQYGPNYSEINLNCGCPSPKVSLRSFGARLMYEPEIVREIAYKASRVVSVPVTVKCRIGVDKKDSYEDLCEFIHTVSHAGVKKFVIHARKCILRGLTPKQNRDVPPLKYEIPHRLARDFPDLKFVLNGGINSFEEVDVHLQEYEGLPAVNGCMIGRAAFNNPFLFATADSTYFDRADPCLSRRSVVERYLDYCDLMQSAAGPQRSKPGRTQQMSTSFLLRALQNMFVGCQGNNRYRVAMNDLYIEKVRGGDPNPAPREIVERALEQIRESELDACHGNREPLSEVILSSSCGNNRHRHRHRDNPRHTHGTSQFTSTFNMKSVGVGVDVNVSVGQGIGSASASGPVAEELPTGEILLSVFGKSPDYRSWLSCGEENCPGGASEEEEDDDKRDERNAADINDCEPTTSTTTLVVEAVSSQPSHTVLCGEYKDKIGINEGNMSVNGVNGEFRLMMESLMVAFDNVAFPFLDEDLEYLSNSDDALIGISR
eukprot:gene11402-23855_t